MDFVSNKLQLLIYHKTKPNLYIYVYIYKLYFVLINLQLFICHNNQNILVYINWILY